MYKDKKVLVVVPARGGSKGVKLKNIHLLAGKPLISYTADVALSTKLADLAIVSTDHQEIAEASKKYGLKVPFLRPENISGDRVSDWDVLHHALLACEQSEKTIYDVVVMLQPTSPFRTVGIVEACIQKLVDENLDSVWTVNTVDLKYHPLKLLKIADDGTFDYFDERGSQVIARQQLTPVYQRNGLAYAISRNCLLELKNIKGKRSGAVVTDIDYVNIDDLNDFKNAESLMGRL